jgi:hypothetical protein
MVVYAYHTWGTVDSSAFATRVSTQEHEQLQEMYETQVDCLTRYRNGTNEPFDSSCCQGEAIIEADSTSLASDCHCCCDIQSYHLQPANSMRGCFSLRLYSVVFLLVSDTIHHSCLI